MELSDFVITPSDEAKICLDCTNKRCYPDKCERYAEEIKKLRREKGGANDSE